MTTGKQSNEMPLFSSKNVGSPVTFLFSKNTCALRLSLVRGPAKKIVKDTQEVHGEASADTYLSDSHVPHVVSSSHTERMMPMIHHHSSASLRTVGLNRVLEYFEVSNESSIVVYCSPYKPLGVTASLVSLMEYSAVEGGPENKQQTHVLISPLQDTHVCVSLGSSGWSVQSVRQGPPAAQVMSMDVLQVCLQVLEPTREMLSSVIIIQEITTVRDSAERCRFYVECKGGRRGFFVIGLYEDDEGHYCRLVYDENQSTRSAREGGVE